MRKIRYQEHHNTELDKQVRRARHNIQNALKTMDSLAEKIHRRPKRIFKQEKQGYDTKNSILETKVDLSLLPCVEMYNRELVHKIDELRKG